MQNQYQLQVFYRETLLEASLIKFYWIFLFSIYQYSYIKDYKIRFIAIKKLLILFYKQWHMRYYQVNSQNLDSKGKSNLYKEVNLMAQESLQNRMEELLQKPNIRTFCDFCELDITRHAHTVIKHGNLCIKCFANLQQQNQEYIVRTSFRKSFTQSSWDVMDQVLLTSALKIWGFGNWSQIKQYLHYNGCPFTRQEIQQHYEQFYLKNTEYLPDFNQFYDFQQKQSFQQKSSKLYQRIPKMIDPMKKKDSKGQKRVFMNIPFKKQEKNFRNYEISSFSLQNEKNYQQKADDQKINSLAPELQSSRSLIATNNYMKSNDGAILGYNSKRKQFEFGQYDYSAETIIAELQFHDDDSEEEFSIKIAMINEYNRRLSQRLKRRQFVVQYKLLDSNHQYSSINKTDKQSYNTFVPYMRYTQSCSAYNSLVNNFSLVKKYQSLLNNLYKFRQKVSKAGNLEQTHDYIQKKRQKYIKNWQKASGKPYKSKQRCIYEIKDLGQDSKILIKCNNIEQKNLQWLSRIKQKYQIEFKAQNQEEKPNSFLFQSVSQNKIEINLNSQIQIDMYKDNCHSCHN